MFATLKEFAAVGSNKPLLSSDPTQPTHRQIAGVPLYVSPAVGADLVRAIPRQQAVGAASGCQRHQRLVGVLHQRQSGSQGDIASVVRLHPPVGDYEDHQGVNREQWNGRPASNPHPSSHSTIPRARTAIAACAGRHHRTPSGTTPEGGGDDLRPCDVRTPSGMASRSVCGFWC